MSRSHLITYFLTSHKIQVHDLVVITKLCCSLDEIADINKCLNEYTHYFCFVAGKLMGLCSLFLCRVFVMPHICFSVY